MDWVLRRLLPGSLGEEVRDELAAEYLKTRGSRGGFIAHLWLAGHLINPSTWKLALMLRRPESAREAGGWMSVLSGSWLDAKLGLRMLLKYPGLTIVAGLGMTLAIAIGTSAFAVISTFLDSSLPLDEGDRIVMIQNWDTRISNPNRQALHDLDHWRQEQRAVEDVSAFRTVGRNLVGPSGRIEAVRVSEITSSGFRVARTAPLLGRHLVEGDDALGGELVVVIGYDIWQAQFAGTEDVIGKTLQLDGETHTVVGVMPAGFSFPIRENLWTPLRLNPAELGRSETPSLWVFGRLAPGVERSQAQVELQALGQRMSAAFPETHGYLRPDVLPYAYPFYDLESPAAVALLRSIQLLMSLLLVVVCVNVAVLVYARTTTRQGEIAVRSALGASRQRVVGQLMVEALVLSAVSAAAGLGVAAFALRQVNKLEGPSQQLPFWITFELSPGTIMFAMGLALLAAMIVGVLPALRVTGAGMGGGLQQVSAGTPGVRLGRLWTGMIVAQVAVLVSVLPFAGVMAQQMLRKGFVRPTFAADQFLYTRIYIDDVADRATYGPDEQVHYAQVQTELLNQLRTEGGLSTAFVTGTVPGDERSGLAIVESRGERGGTNGDEESADNAIRVGVGDVSADFFREFGQPIVAGRGFGPGDMEGEGAVAVVNETFVRGALPGGGVLGQRVRIAGRSVSESDENGPYKWLEIVGVVGDIEYPNNDAPEARLYRPMTPGETYPVSLVVRSGGAPAARVEQELRTAMLGIDPSMRLDDLHTVEEVWQANRVIWRAGALIVTLVTLSVLLLGAAGIYALMSFTVARRRREIGVRAALGAAPRRLLAGIFARACRQLLVGVLIGMLLSGLGAWAASGKPLESLLLSAAAGVFMMAVGLLASVGPARRGLKIQPTEALREL